MEFFFAKELFTYCKYVLFVHKTTKVPTEMYGKYQEIPTDTDRKIPIR